MSNMNGSLFCDHKPTIPSPCKSVLPPLSRSIKHHILPKSRGFETLSFHGRFLQLATVHPPPSSVSSSSASSSESMDEDDKSKDNFVVDERERKRRERIGIANKGRTPWNKGKSHSPATIAKMKERNTIVMQDPRMREKLRQHSHPQSEETKEKLRNIMKSRVEHERKQLTVLQEWKNAIAKTAQIGNSGDDMLCWDSYDNLKEQLRQEYLESKMKKKDKVRRSWTLEQRQRLSESVRAKWEDPDYRNKVIENIREKRLKGVKKKKSDFSISDIEFDNVLNILLRAPIPEDQMEPLRTKIGSYSDPSSKEKLAKLIRTRNMKDQERTSDSDFRDESR